MVAMYFSFFSEQIRGLGVRVPEQVRGLGNGGRDGSVLQAGSFERRS